MKGADGIWNWKFLKIFTSHSLEKHWKFLREKYDEEEGKIDKEKKKELEERDDHQLECNRGSAANNQRFLAFLI